MSKRAVKWVVLLWDHGNLFGVHGPFFDREAAVTWAKCQSDFTYNVMQLFHPSKKPE